MSVEPTVVDHRLELLRRQWRSQAPWDRAREPRPSPHLPFTVAISREAGAPGVEVARLIGQRLGWPVYDREILDLVAEESGLRRELLESVDERDRHWLIESIAAFGQHQPVSTPSFVHHLVKVLGALAARGNCVVVGRGATACLPRESTLRVRIVADIGDRVQRIAVDRGVGEDEAYGIANRIDRERAHFVSSHFHRDVNDAHNFDLVLNASRVSPETCAALAAQALHELQAAEQPASATAPTGKSTSIR
jgi:hypothetical protein